MKSLVVLLVFAPALLAQTGRGTSGENMVRDRGQTRVQPPSQSIERGGLGHQRMLPEHAVTVAGLLVDAGCPDRSALNLRQPPLPLSAQRPVQPPDAAKGNPPRQGAVTAGGVSISAGTVANERPGITAFLGPDMFTRQEDPTCAVTAATHGYALFTDGGRFLNLDEGGNTFATEAVLADPRGRAMLNGQAPGYKPRVQLNGWIWGDRLIVDHVVRFGP